MHAIAEGRQRIHILVADQINGTASSSSSAIGTSHGFSLFATKGNAAPPTIATCHVDSRGIEKFPFVIVFWLIRLGFAPLSQQVFLLLHSFFAIGIKDF
jgi:hypothetical protein